jgi:hypothetical protein
VRFAVRRVAFQMGLLSRQWLKLHTIRVYGRRRQRFSKRLNAPPAHQ